MNVAVFSSSSLLPYSWLCSWTAVGHTFGLAVSRNRNLGSTCTAVWSSRPQLQVGDGASFIFLTQLWPERNLLTTTCCHRSRKWKSSLSVRWPRAALMKVFFSRKVTLSSSCHPFVPSLASSSAVSLPGRPQWAGTHRGTRPQQKSNQCKIQFSQSQAPTGQQKGT